MRGCEDDVVGDQGAAAEVGAVDEDCDLVFKLTGGGQRAADDAVIVACCLLVLHRRLGAGHRPQVGKVNSLKLKGASRVFLAVFMYKKL
jgi:hypothetical protein